MSDVPEHTALNGMVDYMVALDTLCGLAQRSLYLFEKDFDGIGFNSEARHDTLRAFLLANPMNRLHLLAHDTGPLVKNCPRMMMLLRQFSYSMHIYRTPDHLRRVSEPFAVADEQHYVRRFHFDDPRGMLARHDAEGARTLQSRFLEMWSVSRPGASATTLGL